MIRTFDRHITALDTYRADIIISREQVNIQVGACKETIFPISDVLTETILKVKSHHAIMPTYLIYDVTLHTPSGDDQPSITHYGLLAAGEYDAFYETLDTNLICFLDPHTYGRSILENSSFIASSENLDDTSHGQGFVARLSGSTAELLSMWRLMVFGKNIFSFEDELTFQLSPKLKYAWFKNGIIQTTLFKTIQITYVNQAKVDTFADHVDVVSYEFKTSGKSMGIIHNHKVKGIHALDIRNQTIDEIIVHLDFTKKKQHMFLVLINFLRISLGIQLGLFCI